MKDQFLSADKPLIDPKDDRLDFAPYAAYLAKVLTEQCPQKGMIAAICGAWGTGKSTLINFILGSFEALPKDQAPYVVHFSPWLFSGETDLTARFFAQLVSKFDKLGKGFAKLRKTVGAYAELLDKAPIPYAGISGALAKIIGPRDRDVHALKKKIEALLAGQEHRILTVIDDVDRLTAEEVRQLFRVLKAVADFPNITYLLAFDREMVIKALEHEQVGDGEAYLEKIVQATFDVPRIEPSALHKMLFEKLDQLLHETPEGLFEPIRWGNVFHEGMSHFMETPRDVIRLLNVLSASYPPLKNEVNPVDFFALETLRLFCPVPYNAIKKSPELFTGVGMTSSYSEREQKTIQDYHDEWLKLVPTNHQPAVKRFMIRLFPRLEGMWGGSNYGSDFLPSWRKTLRVCSPSRYAVYFHYSLPSGYISNVEMQAALSVAGDQGKLSEKLLAFAKELNPDGTSRLRTFLEIMTDYVEKEIPKGNIPAIVGTFMDIGDRLLLKCDDRRTFSDIGGNEWRIGWVLWPLLKRLNGDERFTLLKKSFELGAAVNIAVDKTAFLGDQQGEYGGKKPKPEDEWLVSREQLKELESIVLDKIRKAAQDASLLTSPLFVHTMYRWADWGGIDEVKKWVASIVSTDAGLALFVSKFGDYRMSHTLSDSVAKKRYVIDIKSLETFLDLSAAIQRVRSVATDVNLAEEVRMPLARLSKQWRSLSIPLRQVLLEISVAGECVGLLSHELFGGIDPDGFGQG